MGSKLFISYAHEDEPFRVDFEKHLAGLKRDGYVDEWTDRRIIAGSEWAHEIQEHLDQSDIILLFISPDFMASAYCTEVEVQRAMQRHKMHTSRVIPVAVRPVDWNGAPFSQLQAIPTEAKAISEWADRDAAMVDITKHLRNVCIELAAIPGNPANPYTTSKSGDWIQAEVIYDYIQTGASALASLYMEVTEKNDEYATIRIITSIEGAEDEVKTINVPLDRPLEDSASLIAGALSSEQMPANAILEVHQKSCGADKLFIGNNVYYTTWLTLECNIKVGREHAVMQTRKWLSEKIPLDGIVKLVTTVEGVYTSTMVVIDYGNADHPKTNPKQIKPETAKTAKAKSAFLNKTLPGNWDIIITENTGQVIPANIRFEASGAFSGVLSSELLGPVSIDGRWWIQNQTQFLEGSQAYGIYNMPYSAGINFQSVSTDLLQGQSQSGEKVVMKRIKE